MEYWINGLMGYWALPRRNHYLKESIPFQKNLRSARAGKCQVIVYH